LARRVGEGAAAAAARISESNTKSNIEVAEPQTFNREIGKVLGFLTAYRLVIRIRMRNDLVENKFSECCHTYKKGQQIFGKKTF